MEIAVCALSLPVGGGCALAKEPETEDVYQKLKKQEPVRIACLGDSIADGAGMAPDEGFVPQLKQWMQETYQSPVGVDSYAAGGSVLAVSTDISKPEDPERLMQTVMDQFGKIDILVNNAGILEEGLKPIDRYTDEDLDRIVETNQKGTMRCMRAASKRMAAGASIVNVASVAGYEGCGGAAYVSSKAAIIGVTKHTALRFQAQGIRCNAVCPGTIVTPMTSSMKADQLDQDMFGAMSTHSNLRTQPCKAEDVANILLFLASDESRAMTGQIMVTDFGASL